MYYNQNTPQLTTHKKLNTPLNLIKFYMCAQSVQRSV